MIRRVLRFRASLAMLPLLYVAACAIPMAGGGGGPEDVVLSEPREQGWRFVAREHVALWYHGLSLVLPAEAGMPLPIYNPAEQERALDAAPAGETPLQRVADRLREEFAGSSAYQNLQFLPLYFDDGQSLFTAIRLWNEVDGDPQRAGSQRAAEAVALLGGMFETGRQRRAVAEFAAALQEEGSLYYSAYWERRSAELRPLVNAARDQWEVLQDSLQPLLRYLGVQSGETLLTPALGPEGRTITTRTAARLAVGTPPLGSTPGPAGSEVAFSMLHELMYSLVGEAISEHVSPARVREFGEQVLTTRAAVRAGALVLERKAPHRLAEYRAYYLRMARRTGTGDTEFRNAYALPLELLPGLNETIDRAVAGI